jgi:2-keto-4-pentenoate hydratase/2-oxohepta-3-ene-1,7-dioic acid hydratase in catechol pathway
MKALKIVHRGACAAGLLVGDEVAVVGRWHEGPAHQAPFDLPTQPIECWPALAAAARERLPLPLLDLAAPLDPRSRIICVGANYRDHAAEIGLGIDGPPQTFLRHAESLVGHGQPLVRPRLSEQFDFEGELAVVIGRAGRHLRPNDALSHVMGYSMFMDGSVRDFQRRDLCAGKNFWCSGAMGPWIASADEVPRPQELSLRTRLNAQLVQQGHGSQMVHDIAALIAYCSQWTPLAPGDVIATGTPAGVGSRRMPPLWMRAGDVIEVEIEGLGSLSNPVIDERGR